MTDARPEAPRLTPEQEADRQLTALRAALATQQEAARRVTCRLELADEHHRDAEAELAVTLERAEKAEERADAAERKLAEAEQRIARLETALRAIHASTREDAKNEQWTIREHLNAQDIYNDDIQSSRRLVEKACEAALAASPTGTAQT